MPYDPNADAADRDAFTRRVYAQVPGRLDEDVKGVMAKLDCDRSTAIRALLRVGMRHPDEVAETVRRDQDERQRRTREAARLGGKRRAFLAARKGDPAAS